MGQVKEKEKKAQGLDRKNFDDPPPTYVDPNDMTWKNPGEFEVEKEKSHVRPKDPVIRGK